MRCLKCNREFPSVYYFQAPGVCNECFDKMPPQEKEAARRPAPIVAMTTTAFTLDGYRIIKSLGLVRGITVRSRSLFGTLGASLQTLVGGNITLFSELCEQTREEAFEMMVSHAQERGANAVIGVRYDATEIMQGVSEVLCYGTAVVVEATA